MNINWVDRYIIKRIVFFPPRARENIQVLSKLSELSSQLKKNV